MLIKLIYLSLFTLFILCSCNFDKYQNQINSGKGTYWNVIKINGQEYSNPSYAYFFGSKGECYFYKYAVQGDGSIEKELVEDTTLPNTWAMKGNIILINEVEYFNHSLTESELELVPVSSKGDTLKLTQVQ